MLQERRNQIIAKITQDRMIKVADLMQEYQVSIETIRRDLEYLEQHGYLKRVYGGAVLEGLYGEEPDYSYREVINFEEKRAIGKCAAELVEEGDTLFIDVGTTCLETARHLSGKRNLTVITNASLIAHEMITHESCRVILLGGELRRGELSVSGFLTDDALRHFNANKAILGVGGITPERGITDYHIEESNTRRLVLNHVGCVIAVADYSKFGVTALNNSCPLSHIDTLVTDHSTPAQVRALYEEQGIKVLTAPCLKSR